MEQSFGAEPVTMQIVVTAKTARILRGVSAECFCPIGTAIDRMVSVCYPSYDPLRNSLLTEFSELLDVDAFQ